MVFVTVGMQKFPFDRLLKALDDLVENGTLTEEVFAQTGCSGYEPKHYRFARNLSRQEFRKAMQECSLVISHGGAGAITAALEQKKPVIVCPRKRSFGEHVDDHQFELARAYEQMGYVLVCEDLSELPAALEQAGTYPFREYEAKRSEVADYIRQVIDERS